MAVDVKQLMNNPTVQLQLLDEITGEALEFVNVITLAMKVYLQDGGDVETAITRINEAISELDTSNVVETDRLRKHLWNLPALSDADKLEAGYEEGFHPLKRLIDTAIIGFRFNPTNGVVTFTQYDGTEFEWDTALEHVRDRLYWCEVPPEDSGMTGPCFCLENSETGTKQYIDFARLVDIYHGETTETIRTEIVANKVRSTVRENSLTTDHLANRQDIPKSKNIMSYLTESRDFLTNEWYDKEDGTTGYKTKIDNIEEKSNRYILPTAKKADYAPPSDWEAPMNSPDDLDPRLGGVIAGHNIDVKEDGTISAVNIMYGETPETAKPVNIFMKVVSTVGPSTDPLPTVTARKSYITSEGNIIIGKDNGLFDYISASTDGTRIENLTIDQINDKLFRGLELLDLASITWYNDGQYNYAVNTVGDGFVYDTVAYVFVKYITKNEFIALINSGNYNHGPITGLPAL